MVTLVHWGLPGCYRYNYVRYAQDTCEGRNKQQIVAISNQVNLGTKPVKLAIQVLSCSIWHN